MRLSSLAAAAIATTATLTASAQTLSLNLPQALADTKASLAAGGVTSIVVIGDSLSYRSGTWLYEFRAAMQSQYGDAGPGYQGWWTGPDASDAWTFGLVGQDASPHHSLDGQWTSSTSGPGTSDNPSTVFQQALAPRISTHLVAGPGGGAVQIGYPDGTSSVINTAAPTNDVLVVPHHVPGAAPQIWFRPLGTGTVTVLGHNNLTGKKGVVVHRVANGGWGVDNYLQRNWTFDRQLDLLTPSLVMIWLGQNDQGYSRPTYGALISALVDRVSAAVPSAEIVLVGTYDAGGAGIAALVGAMEDVAGARGLGFINLYAAAGTRDFLATNGYLDGVHFSPVGGEYFATLMRNAFETGSVAPFCGPVIDAQPQDQITTLGARAAFHVAASAPGLLSFRWHRDGVPIEDGGRLSGAFTDTLTIDPVVASDRGTYSAVAAGSCGWVSSAGAVLNAPVPCPPDINGDGFLDGIDADQFNNGFEIGAPSADYNGDGFVDGMDYDRFMNDLEAGC